MMKVVFTWAGLPIEATVDFTPGCYHVEPPEEPEIEVFSLRTGDGTGGYEASYLLDSEFGAEIEWLALIAAQQAHHVEVSFREERGVADNARIYT